MTSWSYCCAGLRCWRCCAVKGMFWRQKVAPSSWGSKSAEQLSSRGSGIIILIQIHTISRVRASVSGLRVSSTHLYSSSSQQRLQSLSLVYSPSPLKNAAMRWICTLRKRVETVCLCDLLRAIRTRTGNRADARTEAHARTVVHCKVASRRSAVLRGLVELGNEPSSPIRRLAAPYWDATGQLALHPRAVLDARAPAARDHNYAAARGWRQALDARMQLGARPTCVLNEVAGAAQNQVDAMNPGNGVGPLLLHRREHSPTSKRGTDTYSKNAPAVFVLGSWRGGPGGGVWRVTYHCNN